LRPSVATEPPIGATECSEKTEENVSTEGSDGFYQIHQNSDTRPFKKSNLSSHTGQLTAEEEEIKYDLQKQSPYAGRSRFGLDE